MKKIYLSIMIGLFLSAHSAPAQALKMTINFDGATPIQVLDVYRRMSGLTLIEDSRVRQVHRPIYLRRSKPMSKSEGMKLFEEALIKQAGIVITRLDDTEVSVTYNDALPIAATRH